MESNNRCEKWVDWLWLFICGIVSSIFCIIAARSIGPTFDEPTYLEKGIEFWRTGSHGELLRLGTMPLPVDVVTLPVFIAENIHGLRFDAQRDMDWALPLARSATLIFWWLLLIYAMLIARRLAGSWAGRLAVLFIACEPSLVAHAGLATTDIAITACILMLLYHFWQGREAGWFWRCAVPMVCFALALSAKASGLVYGVVCMCLIEQERLSRNRSFANSRGQNIRGRFFHWYAQFRPFRKDMLWIGLGGLALTFVYCGSDWQPNRHFVNWAHNLHAGTWKSMMVWLSENLCIFRNAGEAIVRQIKHNLNGHATYFLGDARPRAVWYYFPVLVTIKLSLPLLIALILLAVVRIRSLCNWAFLSAIALLVYSLTFRVQIGVRLIFPIVALLIVGTAAAIATTYQSWNVRFAKRLLASVAAAGCVWAGFSILQCWPNGLSYVNELWGGMPHGHHLVSDSNYDWGQGLPELAQWRNRHQVSELDIWYFGTDPALKREPFRSIRYHAMPIKDSAAIRAQIKGRYIAVSATLLYGGYNDRESMQIASAYFRRLTPMDRTTTFFIFDMQANDDTPY